MKTLAILCLLLFLSAGCARPPAPAGPEASGDPRSLPPISETARLRIGMHESEAATILGQPYAREPGFYGGSHLWYKLYDPRHNTVPKQFLVTTDKDGYIRFISTP